MTAIGALIGLALAIFLIIKKVNPAFALMAGALAGGLAGGTGLTSVVAAMVSGVQDVAPAIVRVLAAGVLSGVLVVTGAAETIANGVIRAMGERRVYAAMALAAMLLTASGVFIDVAVITVAPIALSAGRRLGLANSHLLLMMIGGGKCGNIVSPNPNTIIAAENLGADLSSVMIANILPAIVGFIFTVWVIGAVLRRRNPQAQFGVHNAAAPSEGLPSFLTAVAGPIVAIGLLILRPLFGITVDPLVALPAGGLVGLIAMRKGAIVHKCLAYGIEKMGGVAVLLVGTGTIAGVIKASSIKDVLLNLLGQTSIGDRLIAPVSAMLMSGATASTTAGATVASASFGDAILAAGVSAVWGAAMINSGATVFDHMPHGSFFHATAGVGEMSISGRLRLIPYESAIGFVLALSTFICYLFIG